MSSVEERSSASPAPSGLLRAGRTAAPPARRKRRRRLGWLAVLVVLLGAAVFVVAAESVSLVRHAKRAQASLEAFKTALQSNDPTAAQRDLRDADAQLAAADRRYHSSALSFARH